MKPKISVILCTHNSPDLVRSCLSSILYQEYKNFEVLCVDGHSNDKTLEVIKEFEERDKRVKLIISKNPLPEGKGNKKWLAVKKAKGQIIAIIDQDNVLQRKDLFGSAIKLMNKGDLCGVLGGLKHDNSDSLVVRYISLFGTDPFFAYRSIDFIKNLEGKKSFSLSNDNMSITGGNCFFYKKRDLNSIGGYTQDVLVIRDLIKSGRNKLLIVPDSTKHYSEKNISRLVLKFIFGKKAYYQKSNEVFNYLPQTNNERKAFIRNTLFSFLILPNFIYSAKIYFRSKDLVSFLYPALAFIAVISYSLNFLRR